jgi:hypothetical protein
VLEATVVLIVAVEGVTVIVGWVTEDTAVA